MIRGNIEGKIEEKIVITQEMKERIVSEIKAARLSQKAVAKSIPIHDKYLSSILNGRQEANIDIINRIASILDLRTDYLLCRDNIRTESELSGLNDSESIRAYNAMIDFLSTIGIKVTMQLPIIGQDAKRIEEEYYRIDDCPMIHRRTRIMQNDQEQTISPVWYFANRNEPAKSDPNKSIYITTPEQAVTILNQFKKMSLSIATSLIETGAVKYNSMSDAEYNDIITRPHNKSGHNEEIVHRKEYSD